MSRRRSRSIATRSARARKSAGSAAGVTPSGPEGVQGQGAHADLPGASEGRAGAAAGVSSSTSEQDKVGGLRRPQSAIPVLRPRFWETVPLDEMSSAEWEALCDGCGKCCLLKLEDADTARVHYTDVTCRLFDCATRRCGQYTLRRMFVPGCVVLTPENLAEASSWMPASCAYRRLHEGRGLADWHPLVSGDPGSVARAGQALAGPTVPEWEVAEEDLEDHVLDRDMLEDDDP